MENIPIRRIMYRPLNTVLNIWSQREEVIRSSVAVSVAIQLLTLHQHAPAHPIPALKASAKDRNIGLTKMVGGVAQWLSTCL